MSRAWRIEYAGALYHVLSRGNERRDIFTAKDAQSRDMVLLFFTGKSQKPVSPCTLR